MHYFVCLHNAYGIDFSKSHKLGECSKNGFYGALPFALEIATMFAIDSLVVPFILGSVIGY